MDELTILTRQEPGIEELDNFDEIKAYPGYSRHSRKLREEGQKS